MSDQAVTAPQATADPPGVDRTFIDLPRTHGLSYRLRHTRHGRFLFSRTDIYIGRSLDLYGEYSELEFFALRHLVQPGHLVVEAGANIGTHTVALARHVGSEGRVIAFEPQRPVHQLLCANITLNTLSNVAAIHGGLGAERGRAKIPVVDYTKFGNFGGISMNESVPGEYVRIETIDGLGLRRCQLIKIDVEGMEREVLDGARQTIERFRSHIYVENGSAARSPALIAYLQDAGYELWWHTPFLFNPDNWFRNPENVFAGAASCNMLCVHKSHRAVIQGLAKVVGPDDPRPIGQAEVPPGFSVSPSAGNAGAA